MLSQNYQTHTRTSDQFFLPKLLIDIQSLFCLCSVKAVLILDVEKYFSISNNINDIICFDHVNDNHIMTYKKA